MYLNIKFNTSYITQFLYAPWDSNRHIWKGLKTSNNISPLWCILNSTKITKFYGGPSWSSGIWIYNCLWNQFISLLKWWVRTPFMVRYTALCDRVSQWLTTDRCFLSTPVSSTNTTDGHDITEILLKVTLSTINQPNFDGNLNRCFRQVQLCDDLNNLMVSLTSSLTE